jgi:membrane dipeptidase
MNALAPRYLDVSPAALGLLAEADVVDLHIDTFIPVRLVGWNLLRRHGNRMLGGRFFGHLDEPKLREAHCTAAMWSITTNPLRSVAGRWRVLQRNVEHLRELCLRSDGKLQWATTFTEVRAARASGAHAVLPAIQGGHALEGCPDLEGFLATGVFTRVTLVHLIDCCYGPTSSPLSRNTEAPLTEAGRALVAALDRSRTLVDLAHIGRRAFWDAVAAHDRALPLVATHTGVCGVTPHWRNLDDAQVRAIADSGGTIGVIFAQNFLGRSGGPRDVAMVAEHLEHIVRVGGEACASLGSDYDGAIVPPLGMRDGLGIPRLVDHLLTRGWPRERILAVLGGNALRVLGQVRP